MKQAQGGLRPEPPPSVTVGLGSAYGRVSTGMCRPPSVFCPLWQAQRPERLLAFSGRGRSRVPGLHRKHGPFRKADRAFVEKQTSPTSKPMGFHCEGRPRATTLLPRQAGLFPECSPTGLATAPRPSSGVTQSLTLCPTLSHTGVTV